MPAPHQLVYTGGMLFLTPNQQRRGTEGITSTTITTILQLSGFCPVITSNLE